MSWSLGNYWYVFLLLLLPLLASFSFFLAFTSFRFVLLLAVLHGKSRWPVINGNISNEYVCNLCGYG